MTSTESDLVYVAALNGPVEVEFEQTLDAGMFYVNEWGVWSMVLYELGD